MNTVSFRVEHASQDPLMSCMELTVEMTDKQRLEALGALFRDMPQEDAAKFIRAEFPELFEGAPA